MIDVSRQELEVEEIEKAGFKQVITNAYLLRKRYGDSVVKQGVHSFLRFNGVVMTDSGAYQILEYGDIDVDQREIIEYEKAIGSDIAVILDIPTGDVDYENAKRTVEVTIRRGWEARELIADSNQAWVMPVQGGRYLDLVELSSREASRMTWYTIYGVGSPTVYLERYEFSIILDMIYTAKKNLPAGKPIHLFGAGHPLIIPYAVALGVDSFDSASYILYARDGRYIVEHGVYDIRDLDYFPCSCHVCSRKTPEELREMSAHERTKLIALHNLYAIRACIERVKQAIREGRLWEYLVELSSKHPKAREALARMRRYMRFLEEQTPEAEGQARALRLISIESMWNPRVIRYYRRVAPLIDRLLSESKTVLLKPLIDESECLLDYNVESRIEEAVIYYKPYLGLIPKKLCGVYPTTQNISSSELDQRVLDLLVYALRMLAGKARKSGSRLILEYCGASSWQRILALEAERLQIDTVEKCGI